MDEGEKFLLLGKDPRSGSDTDAKTELLAQDLAIGLEDPDGIAWYRTLARSYPEERLRASLSRARAIPNSRIRGSRSAIFRYFLYQHAS